MTGLEVSHRTSMSKHVEMVGVRVILAIKTAECFGTGAMEVVLKLLRSVTG